MIWFRTGLMLFVAVMLTSIGGCSKKVAQRAPEDQEVFEHFQRFSRLCREYTAKQGKSPAGSAELQAWAKKLKKEDLDNIGIEDLETALISPRDRQPYVIIAGMGMSKSKRGQGKFPEGLIAAHEQTGENGKRWTLLARGNMVELDAKQFQQMAQSKPK